MKTGKAALATAGLACAAAVVWYSLARSGEPAIAQAGKDGSLRPAVSVVRAEPPSVPSYNPDSGVSARVEAIRASVSKTNARTRAAIEAGDADTGTSAAETADREASALEKELLDSLSSLTLQLVNEPSLTTNAISLLQAESDPETMMMIAQALGEAAAALGDRFPYDLLLKMAESDSSLPRRQAALLALGYVTHVPEDLKQRVAEVSRSSPSVEIRTAAVVCMGSWMSRNRELTQQISETLLATREASDHPIVRGMVIQTIGNMDSPLSGPVLDAMADAVVREPEPGNRSLAAVALGSGAGPDNREAVLTVLENAYRSEPRVETQRHIITQITKASRYDAENYLRRLPTPDPLLAQDVADYIQILASSDRNDWGAIWDKKSDLDGQRGTYPGGHGGHGVDEQN